VFGSLGVGCHSLREGGHSKTKGRNWKIGWLMF